MAWTVERRFAQFEVLRRNLSQLFPKDRVPKLPPKRVCVCVCGCVCGCSRGRLGARERSVIERAAVPQVLRIGNSKFDAKFLEARRSELDAFLREVLRFADPERVDTLDDFLEYAEHVILGTTREIEVRRRRAGRVIGGRGGGHCDPPASHRRAHRESQRYARS